MAFDEVLASRIRSLVSRKKGFSDKRMFGGIGFLLNGNMCVGVFKDWLIVRLDKDHHDETLTEPHTRPFDITGKVMKGWAMIEPDGSSSVPALKGWIDRAARFVHSLPAK
ncbi:MAG: TfoX/Sxy family protein [Planctomycetales bacterium]